MPGVQWVLFSKCRTLQAKSCITSLTALSDVKPEEIAILYVDSETVSYEPLKKQFPCRFVKQTDFYGNLMEIIYDTSKPLIGFMVDDLIFRERLSAGQIEGLMQRHRDLDCFSLRLGRNIQDRKPPVFLELEPGILSWRTGEGLGRTWNYFWDVSSSIYRRESVLDYLKRCSSGEITFPNPLEFLYYAKVPNYLPSSYGIRGILTHPRYLFWTLFCPEKRTKQMACFEKSRAFTQGVNLVAERAINYKTHATIEELHRLFLEGYVIDFKCLKGVDNTKPNAGQSYFRIVGPKGEIHPLSLF